MSKITDVKVTEVAASLTKTIEAGAELFRCVLNTWEAITAERAVGAAENADGIGYGVTFPEPHSGGCWCADCQPQFARDEPGMGYPPRYKFNATLTDDQVNAPLTEDEVDAAMKKAMKNRVRRGAW